MVVYRLVYALGDPRSEGEMVDYSKDKRTKWQDCAVLKVFKIQ